MAQWKIGLGDNYAGLTGFTFPAGENPRNYMKQIVHSTGSIEIKLQAHNLNLDQGINNVSITFSGRFASLTNLQNLSAQTNKKRYLFSGGREEVDQYFNQKIYVGETTWFYYVKAGQFKEPRSGRAPLIYPFECTFLLADPFRYDNTETIEQAVGASGTTSSILIGGNVYNIPEFEFVASSGTVTKLVITASTGGTITISGLSLTASKSVIIDQRQEVAFVYDASGDLTQTGKSYGGRIAVEEGLSPTFSFVATGGSGTFSAKVRDRNI